MVSTPTKPKRKQSRNGGAGFTTLNVPVHGEPPTAQLQAWVEHLKVRPHHERLNDVLGRGSIHPVMWEFPAEASVDRRLWKRLQALSMPERPKKLRRAANRLQSTAAEWLQSAVGRRPDLGYATECLLWAYHLDELAQHLTVSTWWELHDHLLTTARESARVWTGASLLPVQLLAGELPLVLAYQCVELPHASALGRNALRFVAESIVELLDGQGMPHARDIPHMRPLFACWTRCLALREVLGQPKLPKDARTQYEWLVQHVLRMTRYDLRGSFQAFEGDANDESFRALMTLAVRLYGDASDRAALQLALGEAGHKVEKPSDDDLPSECSYQSDWSELAVLRAGWSLDEPSLVVMHADKSVHVELIARRRPLVRGTWLPEISAHGTPLPIQDDWTATCWFSDRDVDYLEIQTELSDGIVCQRQFLLAREDHFLLVMDALVGRAPMQLEFCSAMPLVSGASFEPAHETHEGVIRVAGKRRALVLPLALPEWRQGTRDGAMIATDRGLELRHSIRGTCFCSAQFIDLHPRRLRQDCTWRQLTVAESLRIVPHEEAVGYRVQVGREQWLFYRSLAGQRSRTVLGQHLSSEFLAGRFLNTGDVEALVEVDQE